MKWRPYIRTVLLVVNLVVLVLPLLAIWGIRLYESELISRTETELIAQGVVIREAFKQFMETQQAARGSSVAAPLTPFIPLYEPSPEPYPVFPEYRRLDPIIPKLDAATDSVMPPAPPAEEPDTSADPVAVKAGEAITGLLVQAQRVTLAGIRVTDSNGIVVASTGTELGLSLKHRLDVARALDGHPWSLLRERRDEEPVPPLDSISRRARFRVFVALPVSDGDRVVGAVSLSRTPLDIVKALYLKRRHIGIVAAVLLSTVLAVSVLTSLTISRPIRNLARQADRVSKGETSAATPLTNPGTKEVESLSRAFSHMAASLDRRSEYVRTFAANVSHAFKTPLTSVRGTVELLQDHFGEMSVDERRKFLNMLEQDTRRLERLTGTLLTLARAEAPQIGSETSGVADVAARAADRYRAYGLTTEVLHSPGLSRAAISEDALDAVLSALLDNALRHVGPQVTVTIEIKTVKTAGFDYVQMTVSDDGPGIPPENREKVLEPFFTTAKDCGGTGLGLAIVRALVTSHGGSIELIPAGHGCAFRILLPV